MDESDSDRDDDVPERAADVPYPLEGKYIDEADKRHILGLSQLDREEILGQRAEEMSSANFKAELARRAANVQNDRKRKASSEDADERKSSRPKVQPRKNEKLEAYKREREQRGQQRQRNDDRRSGRRRSSSADRDGGSDVDADGESDVECLPPFVISSPFVLVEDSSQKSVSTQVSKRP
jgi:RNA polymerase-associated protein RTF1